ncbi:AAA family ATPase [Kitasatospora sp. NPDC004615]|uniref:helix-turn-helix transcriptional regulator n=1 Tax=Kitasatospora sp. NPDC004615 TaxID=3364017 RepID=UPI0036CB79C8
MDGGRLPGLIGRQRETELLTAALVQAEDGGSGSTVLLRGDAGVGKSTLLAWVERKARERGFTVLRAVGAEAETDYAFGALHQVFWSLLQDSEALTGHQRESLESAFGVRSGTPSGFAVGAAALTLLDEAARTAPVLLVLDDLHWLDSSSAGVFAFLQRRAARLPVVIATGSRPGGRSTRIWSAEAVDLGALPPADAAALLDSYRPELATTTRERVLAEAAGNPLALVELPGQLAAAQQRGVAPLPELLPLGGRLERIFAERLGELPPEATRLLLLAALASGPGPGPLVRGGWLRADDGHTLNEALARLDADGIARLDESGELVFRHPLARTAVVSAASEAARRQAHRDLAEALAPDDPRRLAHEAAAALLPDDALAHRLETAGRDLAARGGDAEGALLLERAAVLSTDSHDRARRTGWAAVMAARSGQLRHTAALVRELTAGPAPAELAPLLAYAVVYADQCHHVDFESSAALLPAALDTLTAPGADTFGELLEQIWFKLLLAAAYTDDPWAWRALQRHREHVSEAGRLCLKLWTDPGPGTADALLALARELPAEREVGVAWLLLWTACALDSADGEVWQHCAGLHGYATQGSVAKAKAHQDFLLGRWDQAALCRREAEIADELGYHTNALMFRQSLAHFLAGRGDEAGLREIDDAIRPIATRARMRYVLDRLTHLRALVAFAHRRPDEAYLHLRELAPPGQPVAGPPWRHALLFDLVAAAVLTGRRDEALAHLAAARAAGTAAISDRHAFLFAAATALAADDEQAEDAYLAAFAVPGAEQWVFDLARLRLAHGAWLRRRHRPGAREALRAAHLDFGRLRALPWARWCEEELRAAGDPVAVPAGAPPGDATELTWQELRIARLAATGLTNKAIGCQLQLSPRTVGTHLYKVFPKLGITSRAALAHALDQR